MAELMKFTKRSIEALPLPQTGRVAYRDADTNPTGRSETVRGLRIVVSDTGNKSFVLVRKLNGKPKSITIGRFPEWTVDQARREAKALIATMGTGVDPIVERRAARFRSATVQQGFDDYLNARSHQLKPATVKNYRRVVALHLADWKDLPLSDITGEMVQQTHRRLSLHSTFAANTAMKVFRAVYNFCACIYVDELGKPLLQDHPVARLKTLRLWNEEVRRQEKIDDCDLAAWFGALATLRDVGEPSMSIAANYFELLILTGLRRNEAAYMRVEDVKLRDRSFWLRDTKNGTDLQLPMSDRVEELLRGSCKDRIGGYVFQLPGPERPFPAPRIQQKFVRREAELNFKLHDLRRTFVSIAESLDISAYALKMLVNHSKGSGTTEGYIIMDLGRLRKPMQDICDHIQRHARVADSQPLAIAELPN